MLGLEGAGIRNFSSALDRVDKEELAPRDTWLVAIEKDRAVRRSEV